MRLLALIACFLTIKQLCCQELASGEYSVKELIARNVEFKKLDDSMRESGRNIFNIINDTTDYIIHIERLENAKGSVSMYLFGQSSTHARLNLFVILGNGSIDILDRNNPDNQNMTVAYRWLEKCLDDNEINDPSIQVGYFLELLRYLNHELGFPIPENCLSYKWRCQ